MHRWFDTIIRPVLDHVDATSVVEIGAAEGRLTRQLLDWAEGRRATVHSIDPDPQYDVDTWRAQHGTRLVVHRALSHSVLTTLDAADVVLIDGDHNWFTVRTELELIDEHLAAATGSWPVVLLHDISWPYGRRDMYHDPGTIPDVRRQPHRQAGLRLDQHEPSDDAAYNARLHNAVYEGTPRNGVLTAVEDFLEGTARDLSLLHIEGIHGLGVLWEPSTAPEALTSFLAQCTPTDQGRAVLRAVERDRLEHVTALAETRKEAEEERAELRNRLLKADQARAKSQLEFELERRHRTAAEDQLEQLQRRRIVRLALRLAAAVAPLFRVVRRTRSPRPVVRSLAPPHSSASSRLAPAEARADIVVCVHNAPDDVQRCLTSVVEHTDLERHQLIVVDDGSDEETAQLLDEFATEHPDTVLLRNASARGYTHAANQGAAAGVAPFYVLLNSDTIVTPQWLEALLRCAATMPDAAIIGPLSNAASWQSVPETTGPDGEWVVNQLPTGMTVADVGAAITSSGTQLYPEVPLVNGFCYLVRRQVSEELGGLDEATFPTGYGEEDDFSLRAHDAGYRAYIADDAYVFHAKSRSFTPEGRKRHVAANRGLLLDKHSKQRVERAVEEVRTSEALVRARTVASLLLTARESADVPDVEGLRVGWVQPHLRKVGGIRRAIEMTNLLDRWGAVPALITPERERADWLPIRSRVLSRNEARAETFDVLLVSDPDVVGWATELDAKEQVIFHLAAYSVYRPMDEGLQAFYSLDGTHIANSGWTAATVGDLVAGGIAAVVPGAVDRRLFHPVRTQETHDVVCYGSTRQHKGTDTIAAAAAGRSLLRMDDLDLSQSQLARTICSGRVFASGAWHEGFNLPPLEAMACGVPVAMTDDGGSRDYATDGENALVVPVRDEGALREAIDRLLDDDDLRLHLIESGLRTAWGYTWEAATRKLAAVLDGLG